MAKTTKDKSKQNINSIDTTIGRQIRKYRTNKNMSQKSLGEEIGLTFQQVQKYETGKNRVSAGTLYEISRVLKTPIGYFFNGFDNPFIPIPISNEFIRSEMLSDSAESVYVADDKTILGYFSQIADQKVKETIVILLRSLAQNENLTAAVEGSIAA